MISLLSIDPSTNTERENYKFLIGSIIPRPIAFVTSMSKEGILNGAPFSYFNIVSSNLIIGKVVQFHIEKEIYENGRIDPRGLAAVSRLAGHDYAKIGEIFSIERPK